VVVFPAFLWFFPCIVSVLPFSVVVLAVFIIGVVVFVAIGFAGCASPILNLLS